MSYQTENLIVSIQSSSSNEIILPVLSVELVDVVSLESLLFSGDQFMLPKLPFMDFVISSHFIKE